MQLLRCTDLLLYLPAVDAAAASCDGATALNTTHLHMDPRNRLIHHVFKYVVYFLSHNLNI